MSVSPRFTRDEGAGNEKTPSEPAGSPSISAARRAQRRRISSVPRMMEALAFALLRRRMARPWAVCRCMSMFQHRLRLRERYRRVGEQQIDGQLFRFSRAVAKGVVDSQSMFQQHAAEQQ